MIRFIISIIIGALIGSFSASMMGKDNHSFLKNAILGIAGGFAGSLIGAILHLPANGLIGWLVSIILAVAGSCIVILVVDKIRKK